jgi:hypothetical protein
MGTFETVAKSAIRTLLEDVVSTMLTKSMPLDKLRGIALFDPERDAVVSSLSSFDAARQSVTDIPNFIGRLAPKQPHELFCSLGTNTSSASTVFNSKKPHLRVCGVISRQKYKTRTGWFEVSRTSEISIAKVF